MPAEIHFNDVLAAAERLGPEVQNTPCRPVAGLSASTGVNLFAKLENLQRTGSFKERGARNALLLLNPDARRRGVIAASAGNHALALSYHGRELMAPVTVVMPRFAPLVKQDRCAQYGARVLLSGDNIDEAKQAALELVEQESLTYVHGFDDPAVIAGQGTIGLELANQLPDLDAVIVPIGGAGLIAGVGLALKQLRPNVEIIGVEPVVADSYARAIELAEPQPVRIGPTLADGLAVPCVGSNAFRIARQVVDRTVVVDEEAIALAILRILELEKQVVEGGGAAPLAAVQHAGLDLKGKNVALIFCGGNIDPGVLGRVIDHGLVVDGRLARLHAVISDRPGGLRDFTAALAEYGASIRHVVHERAFASANVATVEVDCVIETRDHSHVQRTIAGLAAHGISARIVRSE